MKELSVVFISDDNYALLTAVAITSILKNKDKEAIYNIYLIADNISENNIVKIKSLECENFNINVVHYKNDFSYLKKDYLHVSTSAIIKFMLPEVLKDLDKVLYLDGDIVVQNDLLELFSINIEDYYAAVVKDMSPVLMYIPSQLTVLNLNHKAYFNSGVMLLNLKKLREDNIAAELIEYRHNGKNFFMDQDALNVCFKEKVKYISMFYNLRTADTERFSLEQILNFYNLKSIKNKKDLIKKAAIIHFAGKIKPWNTYNKYFTGIFAKNFKASPYKNVKLPYNFDKIKKIIKNIFSVGNENNYKVIKIMWVKFKFKRSPKYAFKDIKKCHDESSAKI